MYLDDYKRWMEASLEDARMYVNHAREQLIMQK